MSKYVLDFETFYDSKNGYTLKKMTTEEYINDPRFHVFGFSIKRDGGKSLWVPHDKIVPVLEKLRLHEHTVIAHNAPFDMAILNWKYGVRPKLTIDTLAMARGIYGNTESLTLAALASKLGIGEKGHAIVQMDGVRHPSPRMAEALAVYANNDTDLEWDVYLRLKDKIPPVEMAIIDITTRMFSEPVFELDKTKILREIELEETKRETLLAKVGCDLADLRSDAKFAVLLESLGVVPPKKISAKKTAKAQKENPDAPPVYTWAFAKSDVDFKHLAESDDDLVRWACEARLGLKSTIKQSRAQRFLSLAERFGKLPVALTYYGASTGRYAASSSEKINMQNLPSARGSKDADAALLRKAIRGPAGYKVVVVDASQIEARIVAWLAGEAALVAAFANGEDVYSMMASKIYGRHVDRKNVADDYIPGFLGKCVTLGCGYSMSFFKFAQTVYSGMLGGPRILFNENFAAALNVDVSSFAKWVMKKPDMVEKVSEYRPAAVDPLAWVTHLAVAQKIVSTYRDSNPAIPQFWKLCDYIIECMYLGAEERFGPGGILVTEKNALRLPNGMKLLYKDLERNEDGEYSYLRRKEGRVQRTGIYGGSLSENISQALAGAYVKEAMVRCHLKGYRPLLQVHDEIVTVAKEEDAENALSVVIACMTTAPSWAAGLPLAAEGGFADSYGTAKL